MTIVLLVLLAIAALDAGVAVLGALRPRLVRRVER
jgi:hypothetical protein